MPRPIALSSSAEFWGISVRPMEPAAEQIEPFRDRAPASRVASVRETIVGAGFDTWAGSPFVQARLRLLGKTVFLLAFGFFAVLNGVFLAGGGLRVLPALVTQANVFHFASTLVMVALWLNNTGSASPQAADIESRMTL